MALTKLTDSVYVLQGPTNIGLIVSSSGDAVVIDTGIDESVARKFLREAEQEGFKIKTIINTHSHADHIGGNSFIQSRTGAEIYTSAQEAPFVRNPLLEPIMLLGSAFPWKEMQHKFLYAKPSIVTGEITPGSCEIFGVNLEIVSLPGHSIGQIGVSADGVLFVGDAFISSKLLQKHGIPYNVHIEEYFRTLIKLEEFDCTWYVPSHGLPARDIREDLEVNRETIQKQLALVENWLIEPLAAEDLLSKLCSYSEVSATSPAFFFLYRTTVMAYLSYLYEQGRVKTLLQDNRLLWCR